MKNLLMLAFAICLCLLSIRAQAQTNTNTPPCTQSFKEGDVFTLMYEVKLEPDLYVSIEDMNDFAGKVIYHTVNSEQGRMYKMIEALIDSKYCIEDGNTLVFVDCKPVYAENTIIFVMKVVAKPTLTVKKL